MKYTTGTLAALNAECRRIAAQDGFATPKRSVVVGGPDMLPREYAPGAPGWTDRSLDPPIDAGDGTGVLRVPDAYAARVAGAQDRAALAAKYAALVASDE